MYGPIQPWGEQNTHIPHKLFHNKKKHNTHKDQSLKKLSKTECSVATKMKTQYNGLSFRRVPKQNQQRIFTIDFNSKKQINSNLRKVLCGQIRDEAMSIGRRNSKKGIQIGSLKKKVIDLGITPVKQLPISKAMEKRLRSEPRLEDLKKQIQSKILSNDKSLLVKQAHLAHKPERKTQGSLFFRTIANINKERSKMGDSQISLINEEMQLQRKMFLKKNRRFRSWQSLTKHNYSLNSTRQITYY